jgi:hypothetical protein
MNLLVDKHTLYDIVKAPAKAPANKEGIQVVEVVGSISVVGIRDTELNLQDGMPSNDSVSIEGKDNLEAEDIRDESFDADVDTAVTHSIIHSLRSHELTTVKDDDCPVLRRIWASRTLMFQPQTGIFGNLFTAYQMISLVIFWSQG